MLEVIHKKFELLKNIDLDVIFKRVMENPGIQQQFIDFNQKQLLYDGVWADGTQTGPYSIPYQKWKIKNGQISDHVTLYKTGYLQDSMVIDEADKGVVITADMVKGNFDLWLKYSKALGLTQASIDALTPMVGELMVDEYHKEVTKIMYGNY